MLPTLTRVPAFSNDYYMQKLINLPDSQDEGTTNTLGKDIAIRIQKYQANAYCLIVGLIYFSKVFDTVPSIWDIDDMFADYKDHYIYRRISRIIHNMCTSLTKQRKLYGHIKRKVMRNSLDRNWYIYIKKNVNKTEERINTVLHILEEDMSLTPFILYNEYLKENDTTLIEDIGNIIKAQDRLFLYGTDYSACENAVMLHIIDILKESAKNPELLNKAKESFSRYQAAVEKRKEQRVEERQKAQEQLIKNKQAEANDYINIAIGNIDKYYIRTYKPSALCAIVNKQGIFYVLGVVKISKTNCDLDKRVYYYHQEDSVRSDIKYAKRFDTEEEARAAQKQLEKKHPLYITEVIPVDVRDYAAFNQRHG